jgi:hypothetical protein
MSDELEPTHRLSTAFRLSKCSQIRYKKIATNDVISKLNFKRAAAHRRVFSIDRANPNGVIPMGGTT